MAQKKTDLEKSKLLKAQNQMRLANALKRQSGDQAGAALDKRERRRLDQERGLLPFAVKLPQTLIVRLNERAAAQHKALQELVAELLEKGLSSSEGTA